jgi:AraC-like DNA-binding protein
VPEDAFDDVAVDDDALPAGGVWPHDFREAVAALEPLPPERRIPRLADLLLAGLEPRWEPPAQVREAVRLVQARHGRVTVRWLARQVNLSVSQLERGFTRHVGLGPKLLAGRCPYVQAGAAEQVIFYVARA